MYMLPTTLVRYVCLCVHVHAPVHVLACSCMCVRVLVCVLFVHVNICVCMLVCMCVSISTRNSFMWDLHVSHRKLIWARLRLCRPRAAYCGRICSAPQQAEQSLPLPLLLLQCLLRHQLHMLSLIKTRMFIHYCIHILINF